MTYQDYSGIRCSLWPLTKGRYPIPNWFHSLIWISLCQRGKSHSHLPRDGDAMEKRSWRESSHQLRGGAAFYPPVSQCSSFLKKALPLNVYVEWESSGHSGRAVWAYAYFLLQLSVALFNYERRIAEGGGKTDVYPVPPDVCIPPGKHHLKSFRRL